jgi:hypothetical protein
VRFHLISARNQAPRQCAAREMCSEGELLRFRKMQIPEPRIERGKRGSEMASVSDERVTPLLDMFKDGANWQQPARLTHYIYVK